MDSGGRRSTTLGMKTELATQTAQKGQFRTRIAMTAAVQLVEEQRNGLQTDIVELSALRCEIQQLQGCDNVASASLACLAGCRTRPLMLGFGNARLEGAAGPPRGAGDALAGLGAGATAQKGAAQQCPMLSWKCTSNIF